MTEQARDGAGLTPPASPGDRDRLMEGAAGVGVSWNLRPRVPIGSKPSVGLPGTRDISGLEDPGPRRAGVERGSSGRWAQPRWPQMFGAAAIMSLPENH